MDNRLVNLVGWLRRGAPVRTEHRRKYRGTACTTKPSRDRVKAGGDTHNHIGTQAGVSIGHHERQQRAVRH
jgi:hypothetical protein